MLKKSRKNFRCIWLFLGIIFAAISLDEGASLHETLIYPVNKNFDLGDGVFYFSWVIPVGILVLLVFALLLKFYIKLPVKYRAIFCAAAAVYIGGAVGMEMWGAYYVSGDPIYHIDGLWDYKFTLLTGIEEFMEMTGIAILIYGQILYLSEQESIKVKSVAAQWN